MKKEYKRIEIHVKEATMHEKAEACIVESVCYFNKDDVDYICKENEKVYNRKIQDEILTNAHLDLYTISFKHGGWIKSVILTDDELAELCE